MNKHSFKIWAIVNLTPDSFYPGSRVEPESFINRCMKFLEEGADILDIGAESSRPFSNPISAEEEWRRLENPLLELREVLGNEEFSRRVSIDTYKPEIARKVLELGVTIINDITGGVNPGMFNTISEFGGGIVIMHSKGNPKTMQSNPEYLDVVKEAFLFLQNQSQIAINSGISQSRIIWDFGIGFGKNLEHNLALINHIHYFKNSGFPLLVGISRKSFIDKMLDIPNVEERRDPTLIIHSILAVRSVDILRVHDVRETNLIRKILKFIH